MRTRLSYLITQAAKNDPQVIVLSSDHGYALFDEIRKECPNQFINTGIIEQAMIGIAAGLAHEGFKPIVYGLASFVPMRCLEQIKIDICYPKLPVIIIGDGAGLVYSTLGASHHCAEDLACLRSMPNLEIYQPADAHELGFSFESAMNGACPAYIRIGRTDLGKLPYDYSDETRKFCLTGAGSMGIKAALLANRLKLNSYVPSKIKPLQAGMISYLSEFQNVIVFEEHSKYGGFYSSIAEEISEKKGHRPRVIPICLKDQFADKCGSWQYVLSEHKMDDASLERRVKEILKGT